MLSIYRFHHLIKRIVPVQDKADAHRLVMQAVAQTSSPEVVAFANAHAFNLACRNPCFYHHLVSADVLLRDGIGVKWLLGLAGLKPGLNMNGTDWLPHVIRGAIKQERKIALIGAQPGIATQAAKILKAQGANVCFAVDGYRSFDDYTKKLDHYQPEICVLAMGMPRQEALAQYIKSLNRHGVRLFCGGAILDFYTGKMQRAPAWVRRSGLEWLYRFYQEPRRLFGRYMIGNPLFLMRALALVLLVKCLAATRE